MMRFYTEVLSPSCLLLCASLLPAAALAQQQEAPFADDSTFAPAEQQQFAPSNAAVDAPGAPPGPYVSSQSPPLGTDRGGVAQEFAPGSKSPSVSAGVEGNMAQAPYGAYGSSVPALAGQGSASRPTPTPMPQSSDPSVAPDFGYGTSRGAVYPPTGAPRYRPLEGDESASALAVDAKPPVAPAQHAAAPEPKPATAAPPAQAASVVAPSLSYPARPQVLGMPAVPYYAPYAPVVPYGVRPAPFAPQTYAVPPGYAPYTGAPAYYSVVPGTSAPQPSGR